MRVTNDLLPRLSDAAGQLGLVRADAAVARRALPVSGTWRKWAGWCLLLVSWGFWAWLTPVPFLMAAGLCWRAALGQRARSARAATPQALLRRGRPPAG